MTGAALTLAVLLLLIAAALRAAGASLVRTPRADALHDAAEGDRRAQRIAVLLDEPAVLQPAIGMVHSTLLVAAVVPAAWALTALASGPGLFAAFVALSIVVILLGDLLPRAWGRVRPRRLCYRFSRLLTRAVALGARAADLIQDDEEEDDGEDEDEDTAEMELISSVIDFTDAVVREVMVPRTDMQVLASTSSTDEALAEVNAAGRSRIPVTGEGVDDIVGILYAKDLLRLVGSQARDVGSVMRPAHYVPETKLVSELMREMQSRQVHMAIVIDEFGGTAGLVTIEDIIEELVGEIADEYDVEEPMVTPLESGGYLVDARLNVDDLSALVEAELPDEDWDTVGGLVLGLAGRVPREGESFELDQVVLTADRVQGRRVSRVRINRR